MAVVEKVFVLGELQRGLDSVDSLIASGAPALQVDFSGCTFISVDGLEWLEEMLLRADSSKVAVSFTNLPPVIYKVFKVSRIDSLMRACGAPGKDKQGPAC